MRSKRKTRAEFLQELVERYRQEHGQSSVDLHEVAAWAVRNRLWEPRREDATAALRGEMADALREQYMLDPQGRRVRQKHAERQWVDDAGGKHKQLVLWHDIREAPRAAMQAALQQRRWGIVRDCAQLKKDVDSYNDNYNKSVPVQLVFDFREDLEELEHGEDE